MKEKNGAAWFPLWIALREKEFFAIFTIYQLHSLLSFQKKKKMKSIIRPCMHGKSWMSGRHFKSKFSFWNFFFSLNRQFDESRNNFVCFFDILFSILRWFRKKILSSAEEFIFLSQSNKMKRKMLKKKQEAAKAKTAQKVKNRFCNFCSSSRN
jgi:hypothetical protein